MFKEMDIYICKNQMNPQRVANNTVKKYWIQSFLAVIMFLVQIIPVPDVMTKLVVKLNNSC